MIQNLTFDNISEAEARVIQDAINGVTSNLHSTELIRAELIEKIIGGYNIEATKSNLEHIQTLKINGGKISGQLKLFGIKRSFNIALTGVEFSSDIVISNCQFTSVDLSGSKLTSLFIDNLNIEGGSLILKKANIKEEIKAARLNIVSKKILDFGGKAKTFETSIDATELSCAEMNFRGVETNGSVILNRVHFEKHLTLFEYIGILDRTHPGPSSLPNSIGGKLAFNDIVSNGRIQIESSNIYKSLEIVRTNADRVLINGGVEKTKINQIELSYSTFNFLDVFDIKIEKLGVRNLDNKAILANNLIVNNLLRIIDCDILGMICIRSSQIKELRISGGNSKTTITSLANFNNEIYDPDYLDRFKAIDLSESKFEKLCFSDLAKLSINGTTDLTRVKTSSYEDFADNWPADNQHGLFFILNGFEYEYLINPSGVRNLTSNILVNRLKWLNLQIPDDLGDNFKPQPWKMLSQVLRSQGHENEARNVSIERRVKREENINPKFMKAVGKFLHIVSDYGFNPWKTVIWSLGIVVAFSIIYTLMAYKDFYIFGATFNPDAFVTIAGSDLTVGINGKNFENNLMDIYPTFDPLLFSLDTFIPILDLGAEAYWRVNDRGWGVILQYLTVFEQLLGGLFISLIITGFTGMLSKEDA